MLATCKSNWQYLPITIENLVDLNPLIIEGIHNNS
jgi:hypothetical protein